MKLDFGECREYDFCPIVTPDGKYFFSQEEEIFAGLA
jgi:hypothetical protein